MVWLPPSLYNGTIFGQTPEQQAIQQANSVNAYYTAMQGTPLWQDQMTAYDEARTRAQMMEDRDYELAVQRIGQEADRIAISQGQQEANEWYQREMVKLSQQRFGLEEAGVTGTYNGSPTFAARQFETQQTGYLNGAPTLAREQFQQGSLMGVLDRAIQLGSQPGDWVKLARFNSGVSNNLSSLPGLNWTSGGQQGNVTSTGQTQPNSVGNALGQAGLQTPAGWAGAAAAGSAQPGVAAQGLNLNPDQQQIYQTAHEFASNPQGAAPGWYEGLDPTVREMLKGAAQAQGKDWSAAMARYGRSRWGGGSAMAA
jgi:hypothetical protein